MPQDIDESVLMAARKGDKSAFNRIQQTYQSTAEQFVWRLIGQSSVIADIVQNSFLALYLNIERIETLSHMRGFLFRVLRNQSYDILRHQGRYRQVAIEDASPIALSQQSSQQSPEDSTHWTLLYREVQSAIDQLPEIHRQTLVMFYQFDLTYAEIAEAMNVNIGTVKSRIFNSRKQLVRLLPAETINAIISPDKE